MRLREKENVRVKKDEIVLGTKGVAGTVPAVAGVPAWEGRG